MKSSSQWSSEIRVTAQAYPCDHCKQLTPSILPICEAMAIDRQIRGHAHTHKGQNYHNAGIPSKTGDLFK
ncbi:hypothetical protein CIHG_05588 [Coccidioides immitis H538.4]|uniref:Uncharacterized protein n=1 Tax=Coccidioides immitis H538.4 TaxID=396776 RepID=A0A0J8RUS3_COCIT|nr:hypothetical protein CIHG_05588 [Coccidioides immitis H538.4]